MIGEERSWLQRFIIWREKNVKEKRFILVLSFLVGIFTAFAALILKLLIHWIQNFLTENFDTTEANYQYLIYPVVGIFLAGLFVRYVVKDDISHGVTKILYAISRRQGRIKRHNTWSSIIASSITIGFGGSVGAEAPIVLTGSAIGSQLGQPVQNGAPHVDAVGGMWRCRGRGRYFQSSDSGACFYVRGAYDRPYDVFAASVTDFGGDGGNRFLYCDGHGSHV